MPIEEKAVATKLDLVQNMVNEDKADGNLAKQFRPHLSFDILYGEDKWKSWVQQPFDLSKLIERRNKRGYMNWIHIASICNENGVSGFGFIIRDCHGIPLFAYSEWITDETEPVSDFYLQLKAVEKGLEKVEELKFKNVAIITLSEEIPFELSPMAQTISGEWHQRVFDVASRIKKMLARIERDVDVYFFKSEDEDDEIGSALCLAGLAAREGKATLEFSFEKGLLPLGEDKIADLLGFLYEEATNTGPFHP